MALVTLTARNVEYISGVLVSIDANSVTVNTRKPRSSKRLIRTIPLSQAFYVNQLGEEDKDGNNVYIAVPSIATVDAFEGEVSYNKNGQLEVTLEDGSVVVIASTNEVSIDISEESDEEPTAKKKSKKDKSEKGNKKKADKKSKKSKVEEDDEDDFEEDDF